MSGILLTSLHLNQMQCTVQNTRTEMSLTFLLHVTTTTTAAAATTTTTTCSTEIQGNF